MHLHHHHRRHHHHHHQIIIITLNHHHHWQDHPCLEYSFTITVQIKLCVKPPRYVIRIFKNKFNPNDYYSPFN